MLTRRRFLNLTLGTTVFTLSKPLAACSTPACLDHDVIRHRCLEVISAALEGARETPSGPPIDDHTWGPSHTARRALRVLEGYPALARQAAIVSRLRALCADPLPELRLRAAYLLARGGDSKGFDLLRAASAEPGSPEALLRIAYLAKAGDRTSVPTLLRLMREAPDDLEELEELVADCAIDALRESGDPRALPMLSDLVDVASDYIKVRAVIALRTFPSQRGCGLLRAAMQKANSLRTRVYLAMDCWRAGYRDLETLLEPALLSDEATEAGLDAVAFLGARQYIPELRLLAQRYECCPYREDAARVLALFGDPIGITHMQVKWQRAFDPQDVIGCATHLEGPYIKALTRSPHWYRPMLGLLIGATRHDPTALKQLLTIAITGQTNELEGLSIVLTLGDWRRPEVLPVCAEMLQRAPSPDILLFQLRVVMVAMDTMSGRFHGFPPDLAMYPHPFMFTYKRRYGRFHSCRDVTGGECQHREVFKSKRNF